jgi:hypothetical protein
VPLSIQSSPLCSASCLLGPWLTHLFFIGGSDSILGSIPDAELGEVICNEPGPVIPIKFALGGAKIRGPLREPVPSLGRVSSERSDLSARYKRDSFPKGLLVSATTKLVHLLEIYHSMPSFSPSILDESNIADWESKFLVTKFVS